MKIIIPMSGQGSRFKAAGYTEPKPLIKVNGKPIIAHVLDMFPGEDDVIFICNEEHLAETNMREVLSTVKPSASIVSIPSHKEGPVHAVLQVLDQIADDEEVMISYCDFTQKWDFEEFKDQVRKKKVAGAVPSYTGFHPHLLKPGLYGGILADESGLLTDYKEKHCFTDNPEDSYHSSGAYYFSSGALVKKYFTELEASDTERINGETYVSMAYYLLQRDRLPIYVPTAEHFMQWGTPEDLEEYEAWQRLINPTKATTAIPKEREAHVVIPHPEGSREYVRSLEYWSNAIKKYG